MPWEPVGTGYKPGLDNHVLSLPSRGVCLGVRLVQLVLGRVAVMNCRRQDSRLKNR